MKKQYLVCLLLAIILTANGCGGIAQPTTVPFNRFTAQNALDAFSTAGLTVQNAKRDMTVGRGAPGNITDRYVFEIPRVAPDGGQIVVFSTQSALDEWNAYIEHLRADSSTRPDVAYVYVNGNLLLQLSKTLTNDEANAYRDAFMAIK